MKKIVRVPDDVELPMLGLIQIGVIDRGTNLLQVRSLSGCNLNCIFCSVDEGPKSKTRVTNYIVVALDYLIDWVREVITFKKPKRIEIHLDGTGEPMLHPKFVDLVHEVSSLEGVDVVSLQTNGTLLKEEIIDKLEAAGLSRINVSLHSLDAEKSKYLVGMQTYNLEKLIKALEQIVNSSIELLIAPVWVPGINDSDMEEIIQFTLSLVKKRQRWPMLGIQKYEVYRFGRKVPGVKEMSWYKFYKQLRVWEKKYKVKLKLRKEDFGIHKRKILPKVFKRGEKVLVKIVAPGWMRDEMIGIARDRAITVIGCKANIGDKVNVRIISNKHNIYVAIPEKRRLEVRNYYSTRSFAF